MVLFKTGFYKEMPHGDAEDPSMRENLGVQIIDKDKVCKYLDDGLVLMACGGTVKDVLSENDIAIGNPDLLTDGTWVWPGDLSYYVDHYNLKLDPSFVSFMEKQEYKVSVILSDIDFENLEFVESNPEL